MTVRKVLLCICMAAFSCMQQVSQTVLGTMPVTSHADCQTTHGASTENLKSHRARDKEVKDVTGDGMKERIGQDSIEAGRLQQRPHSHFCLPRVLCMSRLR